MDGEDLRTPCAGIFVALAVHRPDLMTFAAIEGLRDLGEGAAEIAQALELQIAPTAGPGVSFC